MVVAVNWIQVLLARALSGLANAVFFPAFLAKLGDTYSYEQRTRAMGFARLAWPISFIFGSPLIGYSIEHLDWRFPFIMMAIFTLITGLVINFLGSSDSNIEKVTKKPSSDLFKRVLSDKSLISGLVMMFLAVGAIQGIFAYWPAWMGAQFQLGESEISIIYSFMGVGTLFGTLLATWIGDEFGPKQCAVSGLAVAAGSMIILSHFSFNPFFVILWLLMLGTSFDFSVTVRPVLLTQLAPDAKGTAISLSRALNSGATAVSTAFSGIIWTYYGYPMIGLIFGSTALIGAIIGFLFIQVVSDSEKIKIGY